MIPPNGIKAIFFDLDGTLRHSVPSGADVFTDYVKTLGLPVDEEARLRAMRWEHLYWANSVDLRDDLLAHSGETENFWIEYSRRRLTALGASPDWTMEFAPAVSKHMGEFYKRKMSADARGPAPVEGSRIHPGSDLESRQAFSSKFWMTTASGNFSTSRLPGGKWMCSSPTRESSNMLCDV
jgi:hypothetical protein